MPSGIYKHKKGYKRPPMTPEQRHKLSVSLKGRKVWNKGLRGVIKLSEKTKEKMRGRTPWNKGKKLPPHTEEWKKKVSEIHKRNGLKPPNWKGKKRSQHHKEALSRSLTGKPRFYMRGDKNPLWKGGITPINAKIRTSLEYKIWRRSVFERDDWACIWCGDRQSVGHKVVLHADNIKPFALFPEFRFAIDNGRTLCINCHKKTDNYLKNINGLA